MNEPKFQVSEQAFQEFDELVQRLEAATTNNFLELAKLLGRDPKKDFVGADLSGTDFRRFLAKNLPKLLEYSYVLAKSKAQAFGKLSVPQKATTLLSS